MTGPLRGTLSRPLTFTLHPTKKTGLNRAFMTQ